MKTRLLVLLTMGLFLPAGRAVTTINSANNFAYGANLGWLDARGDVANGTVIGEYVCSGFIWGANVGWISLGGGSPANGIRYQNNSATDYGVNQDGLGNLRGYAYGANIGWINFEDNGAPKIDLKTGRLSGSVYSANCGWISLSNAFAFVQTDTIAPGADSDGDGIADAWELTYTNSLSAFTASSDTDGDGVSDQGEYLADTHPLDPMDQLRITTFLSGAGGATADVIWRSRPTRCYYLELRLDLNPAFSWFDSGLGLITPDGTTTMRTVNGIVAPMRFYRVEAVRPLAP